MNSGLLFLDIASVHDDLCLFIARLEHSAVVLIAGYDLHSTVDSPLLRNSILRF